MPGLTAAKPTPSVERMPQRALHPPPVAMNRLVSLLLLSATLLAGTASQACEKHLNGHSNSSDTSTEAAGR